MTTDNFAMPADVAPVKDSVGGGGYITMSGVKDAEIVHAYREENWGQVYMNVELLTSEGKTVRESLKILGKGPGGTLVPYQEYGDKKTPLKGFTIANNLGLLSAGKGLQNLPTTKKVINKYDFNAGKEVPTEVDMYMDLVKKPAKVGILLTHKNKITTPDNGKTWVTHRDRKEVNNIDVVFHPTTGMTAVEMIAKAETATFIDQWAKKNEGNVVDKYDPSKGTEGTAHVEPGAAGQPDLSTAGGSAEDDLFAT